MLRNAAKTILLKENLQKIWSNFVALKEEGVIITCLTETCYETTIKVWHEIASRMASSIVCFARRDLGLVQAWNFSCVEQNAIIIRSLTLSHLK